jgi:hypothetical protein
MSKVASAHVAYGPSFDCKHLAGFIRLPNSLSTTAKLVCTRGSAAIDEAPCTELDSPIQGVDQIVIGPSESLREVYGLSHGSSLATIVISMFMILEIVQFVRARSAQC